MSKKGGPTLIADASGMGGGGLGSGVLGSRTSGPAGPQNTSKDPMNDVFASKLNELRDKAAFGVNITDVIEMQSGGKESLSKDLMYTIQDQYVTRWSAFVDSIWGFIVGMSSGVLILALLAENTDGGRFRGLFLDFNMQTFSLALFCAGLLVVLTDFYTVGKVKKCVKGVLDGKNSPKDKKYIKDHEKYGIADGQPKVEPDYQGLRCQEDFDCTKRGYVYPGACSHPKKSLPQRVFRTVIAKVVLLAGIIMFAITWATTSEEERVAPAQLFQASVYGMGAGVLSSILFS